MGWIKNKIDNAFREHKKINWSYIAEARILSTIKADLQEAYIKCKSNLEYTSKHSDFRNQKGLKSRDWEQRMDEILLICSSILNMSVNQAKKELEDG